MDNFTEPLVQIVDNNGTVRGVAGKIDAHKTGKLHLAFSVMCYRYGEQGIEYLIQQRADHKYHSGGLWSNSCCSHPSPGESLESAVNRRLKEEVGILNSQPLKHLGSVIYHFELDNDMEEHEFDHVFLVDATTAEFSLNPNEVQNIKWLSRRTIDHVLLNNPKEFTKWFPVVWDKIRKYSFI